MHLSLGCYHLGKSRRADGLIVEEECPFGVAVRKQLTPDGVGLAVADELVGLRT